VVSIAIGPENAYELPVIFISKIFVTAYSTYLVGKKLLYENLFIDADSLMNHGKFYYVTVTAINSVELQSYAFSGPIAIDTTPPKAAKVINHFLLISFLWLENVAVEKYARALQCMLIYDYVISTPQDMYMYGGLILTFIFI
jgi:hypothetical protein